MYYAHRKYKNHEIHLGLIVLWDIFFILMIVVSFLGDFTTFMSNYIGFRRGLDLIFSAALAILLYFSFKTAQKVEELNDNIYKLNSIIDKNNKKE
ncbi:MAG: DUF2304 domain-containing protein [Methanobrevibacter boviskoreani]|nr:DUF2304 domain-containing protein [Methanobrevibacter boviskoreani]MCI6930915.1 DUF2304 domain-containing protein [Methanobrevibacter boviskoreani]